MKNKMITVNPEESDVCPHCGEFISGLEFPILQTKIGNDHITCPYCGKSYIVKYNKDSEDLEEEEYQKLSWVSNTNFNLITTDLSKLSKKPKFVE